MNVTKTADEALKEVKQQLQVAIKLEHSTIPPYLYAFWSLKDHRSDLASAILTVVKEEMLHMALTCNLLNALGGDANLKSGSFIPDYPTALPAHDQTRDPFIVSLEKCGVEAIVSFMHIELPRELGIAPEEEPEVGTIGEFYKRIISNLRLLSDKHFQNGGQLGKDFAPYKSGILFEINSQKEAIKAISEILEQGEGRSLKSHFQNSEASHYSRFVKIYNEMGGKGSVKEHHFNSAELIECVDMEKYREFLSGVKNVVSNPKQSHSSYENCSIANRRFNSVYSRMLDYLHEAFGCGNPDLSRAIQAMFNLTRPALEVMSIPVDPAKPLNGFCGPTFEYLTDDERI